MSSLVFLLIALTISVIGSLVLWLRYRRPTSIEHGIDEFAREMRALSPDSGDRGPRWRTRRREPGAG